MFSTKKNRRSTDVLGHNFEDTCSTQTYKQSSFSESEPESQFYYEYSGLLISRYYFALECDDQHEG